MTTIRTPQDMPDMIRTIQKRIAHLERHRHPRFDIDLPEPPTRPKPPTNVTYEYTAVPGTDVEAVRTTWDAPTENVDETPFTNLDHYEVENQVGGSLIFDAPTDLTPLRPASGLDGLHDSRGRVGIVRGSSGASERTPDGRDLWAWADATVGMVDAAGQVSGGVRVHNALTWTDGLDRTLTEDLHGSSNLLAASTLQLTGATAAASGTFTVDGYTSTQLTATAATVDAWHDVPAVAGQRYAIMAQHQSAAGSIAWEFRDAGGALLSGSAAITAGRNALLTAPAPANATTLRFYVFRATGQTSGQVVGRYVKAGAFESDHLMLSWRSTAASEQYTNQFTNPDGRGLGSGTYSQLVATNLSTNPSFLVNTTGLTGINSGSVSRVATPSAFAGLAVGRVRRGANGNAAFFRLGTATVVPGTVTARLRVRRAAALASADSTLTLTLQSLNGSTVLASSTPQVITPSDDWRVVTLTMTAPATTNGIRVEGAATGTAWVASDQVDIDGIEFYQGVAPASYFDGSTSPSDGFTHAWTGTAGQSTSTKTATHIRRINHFTNPRLTSSTNVAAVSSATVGVTGGQVNVTATGAGQGVRFSQPTSFPIGATVTASVKVQGSGSVRLVINAGSAVSSPIFILGSGEQRTLTLTALLTATATVTVDVVAQDAASFSVVEPIIEQGVGGTFFHGASTITDRAVSWEGSADASRSIAALPVPLGWAAVDATRERLAYDVDTSAMSVGMVKVSALKATATLAARVSSTALTAGTATVSAAVKVPDGVTVQIQAVFSNAATAQSAQLLPGEPVRHTFSIPGGATSSTFTFVFTGSFAAGDAVHVGEVTLVQGEYRGPSFSGAMSATEGAAAAWTGAAHASTSVLTMEAADQFTDDRPTSLVAGTEAGLPPSHFLRAEDMVLLGSTLYVFLTGYARSPAAVDGFTAVRTGKTYLASFDPATGRFLELDEWPAPSSGTWGTAVTSDGTWLYVYGVQGDSVQVARTPVGDPMTVTYWTGAAWQSSGTPAVAAVGTTGFYGVRLIGTDWTALEVQGGTRLHRWTSTSPQGPFVDQGSIQTWAGIDRVHPRFHPQFDSNASGITVSTVDADAIRFTYGPPGTATPSFAFEIWGDRESVEDLDHYSLDIAPGTPFRVRVRAVSTAGTMSDWALGDEAIFYPEDPVIERPAAPSAVGRFRGGSIFWPGVDIKGNQYEGFKAFHLHMSKSPSFEPYLSNRVRTNIYPGGTDYIPVGDYDTYYVMVVVETELGFSQPSEVVSFSGERLSDPDLAEVLIDGAKIAKGTLNLESLTVGSFANSIVVNPGFEVLSPSDSSKPAAWLGGYGRQPGGGTLTDEETGNFVVDSNSPMQGNRSLRIDTYATSSRQLISEPFPITPGDIYYVATKMRSSTLTGDIRITLKMGATREDVNAEPATDSSVTATILNTPGSFTVLHVEGQVEVPSGVGNEPMTWGAFSVEALHTGAPYSTWIDDVEVRQVVGTASIANAAINRAQIALLAVDDARISNLDGGKINAESVDAGRLKVGVLRTNLIADPSFEEDYEFTTWAPFTTGQGNVYQWRRKVSSTASALTERTDGSESISRSGSRSLRLEVMAAGHEAAVISNAFQVKAGQTYRLSFNACSTGNVSKLVVVTQFRTADWNFTGFNGYPFTADTPAWSNWTSPPLVADPGNITYDDFQNYSFMIEIVEDGWMAIELNNYQPTDMCAALVDDVSVVEVGVGGATELTGAGLRLFDDSGMEVGAFVSGRPNYLSITSEEQTAFSVSQDGEVSAAGLNVATDPSFMGKLLYGNSAKWQPATDSINIAGALDRHPWGPAVRSYLAPGVDYTSNVALREIPFYAYPGRSYRVVFSGVRCTFATGGRAAGFRVSLKTPSYTADSSGVADTPSIASPGDFIIDSYNDSPINGSIATCPGMEMLLRCNPLGTSVGGELNAGMNRLLLQVVPGSAGTLTPNHYYGVHVVDDGPDVPNLTIAGLASGSQTVRGMFTTTWQATDSESYRGDNSALQPADDSIRHGIDPRNHEIGLQWAHMLFGGPAVSGSETGKLLANATSGATIIKAELEIFFQHSWLQNGRVWLRNRTDAVVNHTTGTPVATGSVLATSPQRGRYVTVNIASIVTTATRGLQVGLTEGTPDVANFTVLAGHTSPYPPRLRLTYNRIS